MPSDPQPDVIAADWLIPVDEPDQPGRIIRRGGVRVGPDGRIVAAGPLDEIRWGGDRVEFLDSCVLTPGLINAHAHLDMSHWAGRREALAGRPLHEWVLAVMAERLSRPAGQVAAAAAEGGAASLAAGVTTVVDVTPVRFAWAAVQAALAATPVRRVALAEVIGFGQRGEQSWADAEEMLRSAAETLLSRGLSPHAPYSTGPQLYTRCLAAARQHGLVVMTHLAETAEEVEFCRTGGGPWRDLLESRHGPIADLPTPGCSPVEYARRLGLLDHAPTLLAHVNYLEPGDLELLAAGRAAVVYCPRSAAFFGHCEHPWRRMQAAGINVAVGTDSPASAPDLSILGELRFLHERNPDVPAERLFAMATVNAAAAIGQAGRLGQLIPGAWADVVAWRVAGPAESADAVLTTLIDSTAAAESVFVGGAAGGREP